MKRIKFWIRNYFGFSRKETNGFIILVSLIILLVSTLFMYPLIESKFFGKQRVANANQSTLDSLEKIIARQTAVLEAQKKELKKKTRKKSPRKFTKKFTKKPAYTPNEFFAFDPNTATIQEWQKLGFSPKIAERIQKYVAKGGKFRQKSDLKKIFGFPERAYNQLEAYIQLPDKYERKYTSPNPFATEGKKKEIVPFELNEANTEQLKQIKGIGETLSERIIEFRDRLGGFSNTSQLKDIYGLKPEIIDKLLQHSSLTPAAIQKININTAKFEALKSHPYIKYKLAKILINYREQHGKYKSIDDLAKIKAINDEKLNKLKPYLAF